jgi:phosphoribosylanthranilate isomerase
VAVPASPEAAPTWHRVETLQGLCLPLLDPGGGDGTAWAWQRLGTAPPGVRFGLAGGLDPDTVGRAIERVRPDLVDVSSGVEAGPGLKDHGRIRAFVQAARQAAAAAGIRS